MQLLVEAQQNLNDTTLKLLAANSTVKDLMDIEATAERDNIDIAMTAVKLRKLNIQIESMVSSLEDALIAIERYANAKLEDSGI